MLVASLCFALTGAFASYFSKTINPIQLVLYRNIIGVIFIGYSIFKQPVVQTGGKPMLLLTRGLTGTFALYAFFYVISRIGLPVAITYQQSYPVFIALAAAIFFKDRLKGLEWLAIILGFAGIMSIFLPSAPNTVFLPKYHAAGLFNMLMTGSAYLSIRGLSQHYDQRTIVLSFMLCGLVLPLVSLSLGYVIDDSRLDFMFDTFDPLLLHQIPLLLLFGMAALAGQLYLTKAFSYGKTGVIGAMGYANVVFSILFGVMLGDPLPEGAALAGIGMILISGMLISGNRR
jgi:drug/metabolite transporter (DMT)-like permease